MLTILIPTLIRDKDSLVNIAAAVPEEALWRRRRRAAALKEFTHEKRY